MIIKLPGYDDLRIAGNGNEWQIQAVRKSGNEVGKWFGTNFFNGIEHAVAFAYEKMLRESGKTVDISDVPAECRKVKDALVKAVRKAVG